MNFCYKTASIWKFIGSIVYILKILIPIIIIVLGMIDLGKAVLSSDDKAMAKSFKSLMKRILIGICIFFIQIIIEFIFDTLVFFTDDMNNDAQNCIYCITSPNDSSKCDTSYKGSIYKK